MESDPDGVVSLSFDGKKDDDLKPVSGEGNSLEDICSKRTQDAYMKEVKEILEDLDEKREGDKKVVEEFRSKMNEMVEEICGQMEQRLVARYEKTNVAVNSKIEYLNEILGRVCTLEQELADFNNAVGVLFQESAN